MNGTILSGSRNIFTVRSDGSDTIAGDIECRIKGKILKGAEDLYNPLAPGDRVKVELDPGHPQYFYRAFRWKRYYRRRH